MGKVAGFRREEKFPRVQVIDWGDSLKLPSAVLTTKLSTCCFYRCTHSGPPPLVVKSKEKDRQSPQSCASGCHYKKVRLAIFRFGVGAQPKLSSTTTRAWAPPASHLPAYSPQPYILFPVVPEPPVAFIILLKGLHFCACHGASPVFMFLSQLALDLEAMKFSFLAPTPK